MTRLILAEFRDPDTLLEAARRARAAGLKSIDAHTPFKVEGMEAVIGRTDAGIRTVMLIAGLAMATVAFMLQWYSAVVDYPLDVGGRPLNSWQTFIISSFEVCVLAAGFAGVIAFLYAAGLPRPHSLIFSAKGFERASQDRFFLSIGDPDVEPQHIVDLLDGLAPLSLQKVQA